MNVVVSRKLPRWQDSTCSAQFLSIFLGRGSVMIVCGCDLFVGFL